MQLLRHIRFAQVQQNNQIIIARQFSTKIVPHKIEVTMLRLAAIPRILSETETCSNLKPTVIVISPAKVSVSTGEAQMVNFRKLLDLQPTWRNLFRISLLAVEETKSWIKRLEQVMLHQICFNIALSLNLTLQ